MDQITRTPVQLGAALRRQRKTVDLSQADLGHAVQMRQATVSSLESAGAGTLATLFAVLSALDLEMVIRPRTKSDLDRLEDAF